MFISFFYLLRSRGLDVTPDEWMTLLEGLSRGLHQSSLTGFYQLCRAVLVKSEADFDRFDQVFLEFFKDVPYEGELPQELMDWLNRPVDNLGRTLEELKRFELSGETPEKLFQMLEERLKEQKSEHNGGNYWIGTQGRSPFGNSGWHPDGLRIGGQSQYRTAMMVAGERRFRDFRKDNTLDTRQFQTAFRLLRQYSSQVNNEEVLDVDGTVHETCENGGLLKIQMTHPRKNTIKVLLLMDSGGSMEFYAGLCSRLFQAAERSNHFKELHTYYFHNCFFGQLFTDPTLHRDKAVDTEWVLHNFDSGYKVIVVGDAAMNPYELRERQYSWATKTSSPSGLEWLERLKKQYPYLVWLNPEPLPKEPGYWNQTHIQLAKVFPMFDLSTEGLEKAMKRLMSRK